MHTYMYAHAYYMHTQTSQQVHMFVHLFTITGTHLGSRHDLQQPGTVEPAQKGDKEQSGNRSKVAGVEEGEGHAQKTCAQAHVDHHDVAEKGADGLYFASHGSLYIARRQRRFVTRGNSE